MAMVKLSILVNWTQLQRSRWRISSLRIMRDILATILLKIWNLKQLGRELQAQVTLSSHAEIHAPYLPFPYLRRSLAVALPSQCLTWEF